jgi:RNA recognition motif-containing protein
MSNSKLFVHGFLSDMDEQTRTDLINQLFAEYGEITNITFIPNREYGGLKNFAFVEMATEDAAQAVITNLDGFEDEETGLKLSLSIAKPRTDDRSGGGSRGGFRDKRGGGSYGKRDNYQGNYGSGGNQNGAGNQDW